MDQQQLLALKPERDCFLDRFAPLFGRDENQAQARRFVQGLLHGDERRKTENIAPAMAGGPVRSLQAFISTGVWPDGPLLEQRRRFALEVLADDDAVWNRAIVRDSIIRDIRVGNRQGPSSFGDRWPVVFPGNYCLMRIDDCLSQVAEKTNLFCLPPTTTAQVLLPYFARSAVATR